MLGVVDGVSDGGHWDYWLVSAMARGSSVGKVGLDILVVERQDAIVSCWMVLVERPTGVIVRARLGCPGLGVDGLVGSDVGGARCWPACGNGGWEAMVASMWVGAT